MSVLGEERRTELEVVGAGVGAEALGDLGGGGAAEPAGAARVAAERESTQEAGENASPQPVVSTTSIVNAGTSIDVVGGDDERALGALGDATQPTPALRPGRGRRRRGEPAPVKPSTCSSLGSR